MFQTFDVTTTPETGPERLAAVRSELRRADVDGFLVPRADRFQGEYVAPSDERLAWLTGFTGSAGFAAILTDVAGVFIDGRYRVQVRSQVADVFTPVHWPETQLGDWLTEQLSDGGTIGYDPWLHSAAQVRDLTRSLDGSGITLKPVANAVDAVWEDRPAPPKAPALAHPFEFAGETHDDKRARLAQDVVGHGADLALIALPDSVCWLLNLRGSDIPRNPVVHAFALLHSAGQVDLFTDAPLDADALEHLGADVTQHALDDILGAIQTLSDKRIQLDPASTPQAIWHVVEQAPTLTLIEARDPCVLPKARKNEVELHGARAAHTRDAVAMVRFLAWLEAEAPKGGLSEIDVVTALEGFRRDTNALRDISFETICGAGANGAIVHYRVNEDTNAPVTPGQLLLVDSGGQYIDGTTDITRTIAVGDVGALEKQCYTRVLQGMIAISRARFPTGVRGSDLDALARYPLWLAGQDYDHGTGHGVGSYLSVHEGPQGLSRRARTVLEQGMILSNEPGYYREGAFGIRIENLIAVQAAAPVPGGDARDMLAFETLTYVPLDRNLIDLALLSDAERQWINGYHSDTLAKIGPLLDDAGRAWLTGACAPL